MNKYKIINIITQEEVCSTDILPETVGVDEFVVENVEDMKQAVIDQINKAASKEILEGFIYNDVIYDMSHTDQLNYTSASSLVNMGAENIEIVGKTAESDMHKTIFTNSEAKIFFGQMFAYVAGILSKYRDVKINILATSEEQYSQILEDSGLFHNEEQ